MEILSLGIRHHGPGSSLHVMDVLAQFEPDILVVEGPVELDPLIPSIVNPEIRLPIAAMVYQTDQPQHFVVYPFCNFSPEWNAYQYALTQKIPIVHFDLPYALFPDNVKTKKNKKRNHPLALFAQLAGYNDVETWWDAYFELPSLKSFEIFKKIDEVMQMVRKEIETEDIDILREAYMRVQLRKISSKKYKKIAVVCGAYHVPALDLKAYDEKEDLRLITDLQKTKTQAAWIPYENKRILSSHGYGAGVASTRWNELLFQEKEKALFYYISTAAEIARNQKLQISSAQVMDAITMADCLSELRNKRYPGVQELEESILSCICHGNQNHFSLLKNALISDEKIGHIPIEIQKIPILIDFNLQLKKLKLLRYSHGMDVSVKKDGLDLRNELDKKQSIFLHQCLALEIGFAFLEQSNTQSKGNFKEYWSLSHFPLLEVKIIEKAIWGNTIQEAAYHFLQNQMNLATQIKDLSPILPGIIYGSLVDLIPDLSSKIENLLIAQEDNLEWLSFFPIMARHYHFGKLKSNDSAFLKPILDAMLPRICSRLYSYCAHANEDILEAYYSSMKEMQNSLLWLENKYYWSCWKQAILELSVQPGNHYKIKGFGLRQIFNQQWMDLGEIHREIYSILSYEDDIFNISSYVEGFLEGPALGLIHQEDFWTMISIWVADLKEEDFLKVLPVLRKSFNHFHSHEKEALAEKINKKQPKELKKVIDLIDLTSWITNYL